MTSQTRCWNCKDRKSSCDRTLPSCLNCSKSKRQCEGYGLRLSWPRRTDNKRAIVGLQPRRYNKTITNHGNIQLVNAFSRDVSLHYIASNMSEGVLTRKQLVQLGLPCIQDTAWTPSNINVCDQELLQYFDAVVGNILPVLDSNRLRIRQLLMQMALEDDSPSSKAVLQSMLALASLHRDGDQSYAAQMKVSALRSLMASIQKGFDSKAALQHIATGLVLCAFELQQTSENNSQWVGHLCGAIDVIKAVQSKQNDPGSDASVILGWVYYHFVQARFSLRHWRTNLMKQVAVDLFSSTEVPSCVIQYIIARASFVSNLPSISTFSHEIVGLLSEVWQTILDPWKPQYHAKDYREYLDGLESRLINLSISSQLDSASEATFKDFAKVLHLFRLSALVYLERVSRNFSGRSAKLDQWTNEAFLIFTELDTLHQSFPLFVLGCEAHTEIHRLTILDLIARTEKTPHLRTLEQVRDLMQAVWIQEDLETDGEVEYIRKLDLVFSASDAVPSFI